MSEVVDLGRVREAKAAKEAENEPAPVLMTIHVYADSRVSLWLSEDVTSGEQFAWLHKRMADATGLILDIDRDLNPTGTL